MQVLALAFSLVGISLGWLPGVGWLGLAISAAAVVLGVQSLTDKRTGPAGCGYVTSGNFIGGFALPWTIAFQIKHAHGGLDALLIPWPLQRLVVIAVSAAVVFWAAQIIGRFKARAFFVVVALIAALAFTAVGTSAWTYGDRAMTADKAAP